MEREQKINVDMPPSVSPVLPRSWPHSQNAKPATKHSAAPRATTILYSSPPHLANEARAKGSSLGAGFASLTSQDIDRASDMANAIDTGRRNAERQNDYERDVSESPSALRELGFWGIDREDW